MLKTPLETKSASPDDLGTAFDGFMRAFEAFKDGNDERIAQLEQRMSADVVTTDKVDRINRALDEHKRVVDELALKSARPHLGGPAVRSGVCRSLSSSTCRCYAATSRPTPATSPPPRTRGRAASPSTARRKARASCSRPWRRGRPPPA
jgi:hypothetical protein